MAKFTASFLQSAIRNPQFAIGLVFFVGLAGCAPTVHINTPEPLKVDITMKVDVYQRGDLGGSAARKLGEDESKALRRRDDRSGEIWSMKNDGVVVEGKKGYLEAQTKSGWDPAHVNKLAAEENRDRHILYEFEAKESARPVTVIEEEAGKRLRQQAYGRKPESKTEPAKP